MSPHDRRKHGDGDRGTDHADVSEHRFSAEHRQDLAHHAEERQRDDVDLRVTEEPEQVLPQQRAAVGRVVDMGPEFSVGFEGQQCGCQHRECLQCQDRCEEYVPGEDRHAEHGHAGSAQTDDGRDEIHGSQGRTDPGENQAHGPQVTAYARGEDGTVQRGIGEPTEGCRAARDDESRHDDQPAEKEEPVRERVETGKATSGEPICSGMTAFANPANIGVANNSIMMVPCTVNSWLY